MRPHSLSTYIIMYYAMLRKYILGKKNRLFIALQNFFSSTVEDPNWADMLIRGFGSPAMYEEAYGWLYHCDFDDDYSKAKKKYLEEQLKKYLPPNVVARNEAFAPDF